MCAGEYRDAAREQIITLAHIYIYICVCISIYVYMYIYMQASRVCVGRHAGQHAIYVWHSILYIYIHICMALKLKAGMQNCARRLVFSIVFLSWLHSICLSKLRASNGGGSRERSSNAERRAKEPPRRHMVCLFYLFLLFVR